MRSLVGYIAATWLFCCCSGNDSASSAFSAVELALADDCADNQFAYPLDSMPDNGCVKLKINGVGGTLGRVFNDSNYKHFAEASRIGIRPLGDEKALRDVSRDIVKIYSCREYFLDKLTHSLPYLIPEAADLLHEIGARFNDSLAARGGGAYRIKVTSLLRTPRSVKRLRRVNRNSVDSSTHIFATTFDISYVKFACDSQTVNRTQEDLKNLLAEVLFALRSEGRCFVKYERKQGCFHITTRISS